MSEQGKFSLKQNELGARGPQGAVVSEFSTRSVDEKDIFIVREIQRLTRIV